MSNPTFEEQCQLGKDNRKQCQHTSCQHHKSIFYNKCWDCTTFDQAPPTPTKEVTSPPIQIIRRAPEATQAEETPSPIPIDTMGKRRDVITEMPYWLQKYKKEQGLGPGQVREQPGQTWEITLPHSSALHREGTAKEQKTQEDAIQELAGIAANSVSKEPIDAVEVIHEVREERVQKLVEMAEKSPEAINNLKKPANTDEPPKRYVTVNEMFWMNPKELKRLQKDPNVVFV